MVRAVDPFDYWASHASAIKGMGGAERSPDPRYLFHTRYHDVRAGRARYILRLAGVRAGFGELSVRVHAWRPEGDSNVSLVSGTRMSLGEDGSEVTLSVHFAAQKGVLYAFYGYLTEDSDISAHALDVTIDEPEDAGEVYPEPPRSILALDGQSDKTHRVSALIYGGRTRTAQPVSQSCTIEQVVALGFLPERPFGPEMADAAIAHWSDTLSLSALDAYGASHTGMEGLVVGPVAATSIEKLGRWASVTRLAGGPPPPRSSSDFFDFLLMPAGPDIAADAHQRLVAVENWLARLKVGGLGVLGVRYCPESDLVSSSAPSDAPTLSRNEIGQWALRLIGSGYSVAPLAFAGVADLVIDRLGLAGFLLIIQRL